ncbi:PAS domain S-box protein [uncultured Pseudodesulfovibrio sp.]|uniref:PAS domain S-box protein n=1 Tax=uncultured Pseudodesulfovibrio sp. TaxID=2035858 RepID=UPI0029C95973|nr:PAS domain S-box protein [uncultured Pseudodesulfovibrio sp.]
MNLTVVLASMLFQFVAGFLALRLIVDTGRSWAWILLATGIFIMAFRRVHALVEMYSTDVVSSLSYECLGLVISILLFLGVLMVAPMIRDMRNATDRLARSEERYRTVAEFTHDWEYWLSPNDTYLYVSPACERLTGYGPDEFFLDPELFNRLIHPDDREAVLGQVSSVEKMHQCMRFDCRIVARDGRIHWVAYNSLPVYSSDGLYLGVRASVREIDHRKRLEAELRESRALYQRLIEDSRSMILRLDASGLVTFVNNQVLSCLECLEPDLLGSRVQDVLFRGVETPDPELVRHVDRFLTSGSRLELESEVKRPCGSSSWCQWEGSVLRDIGGEVSGFVLVGIDVSNRKALDKLKENVTRVIRHDLKSPLSGIIGIPRMLRAADNITPKQAELLKAVEDAGSIMLELLNQSISLYKLETGTYAFSFEEFDLVELLDTVVNSIQVNQDSVSRIMMTVDGVPVEKGVTFLIRAEQPLVFSLFSNLLRNAFEAGNNEPISVGLQHDDGYVARIHNAGVVPESIRNTFFDKYVTAGKPGGTGLGTFSAMLIARSHGGDIEMQSSEESGTTITVRLPLREECVTL